MLFEPKQKLEPKWRLEPKPRLEPKRRLEPVCEWPVLVCLKLSDISRREASLHPFLRTRALSAQMQHTA